MAVAEHKTYTEHRGIQYCLISNIKYMDTFNSSVYLFIISAIVFYEAVTGLPTGNVYGNMYAGKLLCKKLGIIMQVWYYTGIIIKYYYVRNCM